MIIEIIIVVVILYFIHVQYRLHHAEDVLMPSTWDVQKDGQLKYEVNKGSEEFDSVSRPFCQGMGNKCNYIIRIERIQNRRWYAQYKSHERDFEKRLETHSEKRLYHGCPEESANHIIESWFNRSYAGVNGTVYGQGAYFSSKPNYSHNYAKQNSNGERFMFVVSFLVGKAIGGNNSMKVPPSGYDTTTDGNHIFVAYHDAQAYPDYLITYK